MADGVAEPVAEVSTLWHKRHHARLPAAVRIWTGSSASAACRSAGSPPYLAGSVVRRVALAVKNGRQWREMPGEFGAWPTVHNRFRQGRDADVLKAGWWG
ncbi:transposase [Streptomyces sp. HPF1205]|uniref:transposase n=1 Tax=Streptomyces sp. HPF1205 TaxID=2873262 RepID=UPI0035ABBD38